MWFLVERLKNVPAHKKPLLVLALVRKKSLLLVANEFCKWLVELPLSYISAICPSYRPHSILSGADQDISMNELVIKACPTHSSPGPASITKANSVGRNLPRVMESIGKSTFTETCATAG